MEYRLVEVILLEDHNEKKYTFADYTHYLSEGNLVVVDTCNGLKLGRVVSLDGKESKNKKLRDVVNVVDTFSFDERCKAKKRREELKIKMDAKVKELQTIAVYEMLAEKDPELAEMLDEYNCLM